MPPPLGRWHGVSRDGRGFVITLHIKIIFFQKNSKPNKKKCDLIGESFQKRGTKCQKFKKKI